MKDSASASDTVLPTYVPVTSAQINHTRPVVILGDLKHNISEDLLSEFSDNFSNCVPRKSQKVHGF